MKKLIFIINLICLSFIPISLYSQISVDLEGGFIISGYNDIRDPADEGTLFSFSEDLESDNEFFYRLRLNYKFAKKHNLSILYAPLTINAKGKFDKDVRFKDETYLSGTDVKGRYTFNSYRLTYRYNVYHGNNAEFGLGLTGKIRDAEIVLNNDQDSDNNNLGFVPLINFRLFLKLNNQFGFLLAGDALAGPQGRAEDVLAAFTYAASDKMKVKLG